MTGFQVILGNPPFLNQLESATTLADGIDNMVRARLEGAVRGYTDLSATFLLFATTIAARGGRVAMVQPQSLLAVKDAAPIRRAILKRASLESIWVSNEHVFRGVSVFTCAPTLHIEGPRRGRLTRLATGAFTRLPDVDIDADALMREETWAHFAAAASGIPEFALESSGTVSTIADATADFRDQFYGLDGFLVEDVNLPPAQRADWDAFPPIVTTGLIDLAECRWGIATCRILKKKWEAPRVDRHRMNIDGSLGPWITARLVPKVLMATQTRVIELWVDEAGRIVPSIPIITITPKEQGRLWHVAAAVASPVSAAIAMQKYAGAALSADAIKLSAKQVLLLPCPADETRWTTMASHFREASLATDAQQRAKRLRDFGTEACAAFRLSAEDTNRVMEWWLNRLHSEPEVNDG